MAIFPMLSTGAVTQYPSGRRVTFRTCITTFLDGSEQRFREIKQPVRSWVIRLHELTASETATLESFFEARQGQFGSFTFVDPWDGTEYPDCSFEQDSFSVDALAESQYRGYLIVRNNTP